MENDGEALSIVRSGGTAERCIFKFLEIRPYDRCIRVLATVMRMIPRSVCPVDRRLNGIGDFTTHSPAKLSLDSALKSQTSTPRLPMDDPWRPKMLQAGQRQRSEGVNRGSWSLSRRKNRVDSESARKVSQLVTPATTSTERSWRCLGIQ